MTSQIAAGSQPGGTVTFYDGGTLLPGAVQITSGANGQIYADIYNISFSTTGPHSISAKYSGDSNYNASTSSPLTMVCLIPTTITQSESPTNITYGQNITVTATLTASSKGPAITGQIFFEGLWNATNQTTVSGTDASGNQTLTTTLTSTPDSTGNLIAVYQGDAVYGNSSNTGPIITVYTPDFSLGFPDGVLTVTAGQSGSLAFQVIPVSNDSSSVSLACSGNVPSGYSCSVQPATVNLANGAVASATLTLTPTTMPASGKAVRPRRSIIGLLPEGRNPLWPVSLLIGLAAVLFLGMTHKPKYLQVSVVLCLVCVLSTAIGCGGGGGSGGGGSNSGGTGGGGGTVGPYATTTTVSTSAAKIASGAAVTFTAKVSGQGNPIGGVDFFLNNSWYGKGDVVAGTATLTTNINGPGSYSLTASYEGDPQDLGSTSGPVSQAVTGSTVISVGGQTGINFHNSNVTVILQ